MSRACVCLLAGALLLTFRPSTILAEQNVTDAAAKVQPNSYPALSPAAVAEFVDGVATATMRADHIAGVAVARRKPAGISLRASPAVSG